MVQASLYSIFKKIVTTTIFRGMGAIATLLMTLAITRNFSTDIAGITLFSIALITALGQVFTIGCHQTATKITGANLHAKNWQFINTDIAAFINIILTIGLLSFALSFAHGYLFPDAKAYAPAIIMGATGAALIQLIAGALIGAQRQNSATLFLNGLTPLLTALVISSIVQYQLQVTERLLVWVYVASLGASLLSAFFVWYFQPLASYSATWKLSEDTKNHAKYLYPVVLAQLSTQYSSQFAIAYFLTDSDFAYFSSALRTSLLVSFILMAANLVVAGKFAEHYSKNDLQQVNKLALLSSRVLVGIAIPIGAFILLFSDGIMSLFGEDYTNGSLALQIMVFGQLINVATGATNYLLSMCGQEKALRKVLFVTFGIATTSAAVLTPMYGIMGAACATALAVATQNLFAAFYVKRYLGFNCLNIFRTAK